MDNFINIFRGRIVLSITNRYLLVLNGFKANLTLKVVQKAKRNGIDMLTFPSYASHGLRSLDIICFKSSKVAFRAYKNAWCVRNHGVKVKKNNLASWIFLAFKKY